MTLKMSAKPWRAEIKSSVIELGTEADENLDEDEVPEDQTVIESGDAVRKLVEKWSEDDGEADFACFM